MFPVNFDELKKRFNHLVNETIITVLLISDPVSKERRIFYVSPDNCLVRDIASQLIYHEHPLRSFLLTRYPHVHHTPQWYCWRNTMDNFVPSSQSWKVYLTSFYQIVEPFLVSNDENCRDDFLIGKLSMKTVTRKLSHRVRFQKQCEAWTRRTGICITFLQYLQSYDAALINMLELDSKGTVQLDHPFLNQLYGIIFEFGISVTTIHDALVSLHRTTVTPLSNLVMRVKLYINRADLRAYYIDKCLSRHVAGAIFQACLQGSYLRQREKLAYEEILPAKGRNILDYWFDVRLGEYLRISMGDISSFTNSCVNSWVLALALLLLLFAPNMAKFQEPFKIRLSGIHLTATLPLVILVYLFTTVGIPAQTAQGPHVAPGGYLGIKANMSLTTFAFAIILMELRQTMRTTHDQVTFHLIRIGGDDFALAYSSLSIEQLDIVEGFVKLKLRTTVGFLKEFVSDTYDCAISNVYTCSSKYCKKDVAVTVSAFNGGSSVHLQSQDKLPFMGELIDLSKRQVHLAKRVISFQKFNKAITRLLAGYDGEWHLINAYRYAYITAYNIPCTIKMTDVQKWMSPVDFVVDDKTGYTHTVKRSLESLPILTLSSGEHARYTLREQISYLTNVRGFERGLFCIIPHGSLTEVIYHPEYDANCIQFVRRELETITVDRISDNVEFVHDLMQRVRDELVDLI